MDNKKPGRPALPDDVKKKAICLRLPPDLIEWMRARPASMPKLVEAAMRAHYGIKK